MVVDGERLKALLTGAKTRVLLCAPFIKSRVLETLLSVLADSVPVRIVTRWRPEEIAAGVSDLEVFEVVRERLHTELSLLDDLHAKLYVADEQCLLGSANLTATALGWADRSNVELLVPARVTDTEVVLLMERLELATVATFKMRSEMAAAVATLDMPTLPDGKEVADWGGGRSVGWLPRCAAPDKLYEIYENRDTAVVADGTRDDGLADLRDLNVHPNLSRVAFSHAVREALRLMPTVARILGELPRGVADARGVDLVLATRPNMVNSDASEQWRIVRDWIAYFFGDQFEVAPESFVTRLKSR